MDQGPRTKDHGPTNDPGPSGCAIDFPLFSLRGGSVLIAPQFVTTCNELPDCRIVRSLGLVRGVTVRSRSIVGTVGASIQSLFGGNITLWSELCEHARLEAYELMTRHAEALGANAVIAMRYDATEIAAGVTEVLAYGTAVVVERSR